MPKVPLHSRNPLRVLLVSPLPPPSGGIGRWAVLALGWLKTKPEASVSLVDTAPRWRAVEDLKLWKRAAGGVLQGLRDAWRTVVQFLVFRPHVLHLNTSAQLRGPWDTGILAVAALMRVPSIYHIHMGRLPEVMARNGGEWWGLRWALALADRVVVLDQASEQALKRFLPSQQVVRLPNAIAPPPVANAHSEPEPPNVLYLGHVVPSKGMRELMGAWRQLCPQGWRLRLAGLGSAAYRKELLGIAGAEAQVEFLGDLSPEVAWRHMQAADICVLPTYTEGFPNVILEAMAAGKAVISTRVGAIPEMLDADGEEPCGLVIAPRDVGALADGLRELMGNFRLREALGRRAHAKVLRCYTTDVVFGQLLSLWRGVGGEGHNVGVQNLSPGTH